MQQNMYDFDVDCEVKITPEEQAKMKRAADLGPRVKLPPQKCPDTLVSYVISMVRVL